MCYKKNPLKNPLYEKVQKSKKGPFVVESFVTVGSFDFVCTPPPPSHASPTNVHAPTINDQQQHV
jgi:hypothetical protein